MRQQKTRPVGHSGRRGSGSLLDGGSCDQTLQPVELAGRRRAIADRRSHVVCPAAESKTRMVVAGRAGQPRPCSHHVPVRRRQ